MTEPGLHLVPLLGGASHSIADWRLGLLEPFCRPGLGFQLMRYSRHQYADSGGRGSTGRANSNIALTVRDMPRSVPDAYWFVKLARFSYCAIIDRIYAMASSAGGLEGNTPSKKCFFPPDWAAGYPLGVAQSGGKEGFWGGRVPSGCLPKPLHYVSSVTDSCSAL
jgi:hypothetical protein